MFDSSIPKNLNFYDRNAPIELHLKPILPLCIDTLILKESICTSKYKMIRAFCSTQSESC